MPVSFPPYDRHYLEPLRVTVSSEPTEKEWDALSCLPDLADDVPPMDRLRALARRKSMAVLVASAAFTRTGEPHTDCGIDWRVVGALIAPLFVGRHPDVHDIDRRRFNGQTVCEIQELVADQREVNPTFVMAALLCTLQKCRHELEFDVIRAVVDLRDHDFLTLLKDAGFEVSRKTLREISMIRVG